MSAAVGGQDEAIVSDAFGAKISRARSLANLLPSIVMSQFPAVSCLQEARVVVAETAGLQRALSGLAVHRRFVGLSRPALV